MGSTSTCLQVAVTPQIAVVRVTGRANFTCSVDFKALVYELKARGYRRFVLDLGNCVLMDSTFLGVLAGFGLKVAEGGDSCRVTLLNPNDRIRDLLENLGVNHLFQTLRGELTPEGEFTLVKPERDGPSKVETSRVCLEAHETLMAINPANIPKFKDVTRFMAEDLKRLESQAAQ
jgi:anti-anti-sigma factor